MFPVKRLIWLAAAGASVTLAVALVAMLNQRPVPWPMVQYLLTVPVPFLAIGVYLLWRRPEHRVGWLLVGGTVLTSGFAAPLEWLIKSQYAEFGPQTWMSVALLAEALAAMVGVACFAILFGLFPMGTPETAQQRRFAAAMGWLPAPMLVALLANRNVLVDLVAYQDLSPFPNPIHIHALAPLGPATVSMREILYSAILVGFVVLVVRYRRESSARRQQMRWVLFGVGAALAIGAVPFLLQPFLGPGSLIHGGMLLTIGSLALPVIPVSIVTAMEQPVWLDSDAVIRKSFIYGALSLGIFLVYAAVAAGLGLAAGGRLPIEVAILVTAVLAFGFQPMRTRLTAVADRWVFGGEHFPLETIGGLEEGDQRGDSAAELGDRLAHLVRAAARLQWVAVSIPPGPEHTAGSVTGSAVLTVPLASQGEQLGEIRCGPKLTGTLTDADTRLITALGHQAALLVANRTLAGRIVQVQEAERRRIERNIHDGAQQELVALVAKLGLARAQIENKELDEAFLVELQQDAQTILRDLRDLAQGIHPSVLTDGGLVEAVEDRCSRLPLHTHVAASEGLRTQRFDDDIEGAAFFFVSESLANILKHARASEAHVEMAQRGKQLELTISDNGVGFDPGKVMKHGLAGLHDRFTALSGSVNVEAAPGAGTVVKARLPVNASTP